MKRLLTLSLMCGLGLFLVGCDSTADNQVVGGDTGVSPAEVKQKNDDYMSKMNEANKQNAEKQAGGGQ